ncbi:TRAP transporter small permease subunit [Paracoccus marinaquae]|uniref:TRAP transporter small permease protein n=1 Tax=Paracoccus marinaquae TaxID=2841926 RepID=A0ABS6AJT8_9RHOB|nr:TRAP transporter small permease subunit [Paracoccus marinaquae]MBU3029646.1 TRAP transporter small permease [Paracoccus marinaquae]
MRVIERTLLDLAVLATVMLCAVVVGNAVFGSSTAAATGLVRDLMIATIMLPLAAASAARAHVAVTFLTDRLPHRPRGWLILFGHAVALLALLPLIHAGFAEVMRLGATTELPDVETGPARGPGIALFLAGLSLMWLRIAIMLVADLREFRATGTITDEHGQEAV